MLKTVLNPNFLYTCTCMYRGKGASVALRFVPNSVGREGGLATFFETWSKREKKERKKKLGGWIAQ